MTNDLVIRPKSYDELERFAVWAAKSDFVPEAYQNKPHNIMIAIQMGSEVGLAPLAAIQNIAVIGGRPTIWGDAMLGVVRASGLLEHISETIIGAGDSRKAVCVVRRVGDTEDIVGEFSVADAKQARLWTKGIWQSYPDRMLKMRARGFALRDAFPDVLKGLISYEEARDYSQTVEHDPEEKLDRIERKLGDTREFGQVVDVFDEEAQARELLAAQQATNAMKALATCQPSRDDLKATIEKPKFIERMDRLEADYPILAEEVRAAISARDNALIQREIEAEIAKNFPPTKNDDEVEFPIGDSGT